MAADLSKGFHEVPFRDFVEAIKPMGSANRLPAIGKSEDVLIYQVHFNGHGARYLPAGTNEYQYGDMAVHKLTESLGLDSKNFRDNVRVAEILAVRSAWISAVLSASADRNKTLSADVISDYEQLTSSGHAWLQEQVNLQRQQNAGLALALRGAEERMGGPVVDKGVPETVNRGQVVSQNEEFTVQDVGQGMVVAHVNDRLPVKPAVGDIVTIAYYRGQGQVLGKVNVAEIVGPYLDDEMQDLALRIKDAANRDHLILFPGVAGFKQFVETEGLDPSLIETAVEVYSAKRVRQPAVPQRRAASGLYIDEKSGALALDYLEDGVPYTKLFSSARDVQERGAEYGLKGDGIKHAEELEQTVRAHGQGFATNINASYEAAREEALKRFDKIELARGNGGRYAGAIIAQTQFHIVQDNGRGEGIIHNKLNLDKVPAIEARVTVLYNEGRGRVAERGKGKSQER